MVASRNPKDATTFTNWTLHYRHTTMMPKFLTAVTTAALILAPAIAHAELVNVGVSERGPGIYVDSAIYRKGDTVLFWLGLKSPVEQKFSRVQADCAKGEFQFVEPERSQIVPARYGSVIAIAMSYACNR